MKNVNLIKYVLAASMVLWTSWSLTQFFLAKEQTKIFCEDLKIGELKNDLIIKAENKKFIFSTYFFHTPFAHGRFVCMVDFDKHNRLINKKYSFLD